MSTKTNILTVVLLLFIVVSCTKNEILDNDTSKGVKSATETFNNSPSDNNSSILSKNEVALLFDEDEIDLSSEVLVHINNYRNKLGLKSLIDNKTAKIQALSHSKYQSKNNQISHTDSSIRAAAIFKIENASFYGENVAFGYSNIEKLVQAWINSESHRINIEGDFTYSGIGTIANDKGVLYFTQIFFK